MIDSSRLQSCYERARNDLLAERTANGHWIGELASSSLATATAVSALSLVRRERKSNDYDTLIDDGIAWIISQQNTDGGWGDTDRSYSNIATTMLVVAALHLADHAGEHTEAIERAEKYIDAKGSIDGLRQRYGKDKTFAVPILTNCALAGLVPWSEVSSLPFEAACVPQKWYRLMQMPVVSYAIPALVAIGQAIYFHRKPWNPITRLVRWLSIGRSLRVLEKMQPASGGYLEAAPLTSFVTMALAGTGRADHPVARNGVKYLLSSVREDGSWPIDTNLATWTTTLSMNALVGGGEQIADLEDSQELIDWVLSCQHTEVHPFTGAEPGGFGWTDLSGAVPDADDTPGALLALAHWAASNCDDDTRIRIREAARNSVNWLLHLQNRNGGWPTFCRGWGKLPFDRSGSDLTAHAIRALEVWRDEFESDRIESAIRRGFDYLDRQQQSDGSWLALWFGNQDHADEENPIYGTAKVLLAYRDDGQRGSEVMQRGLNWLRQAQNPDGGWGGGLGIEDWQVDPNKISTPAAPSSRSAGPSSVEETALAIESLLIAADDPSTQDAINKGLEWLCCKVERNEHGECSPIGFYFAKLWYYERLYPLIFTVSALGQALRQSHPSSESKTEPAHLT